MTAQCAWAVEYVDCIVQRWFWKFLTYPCITQHCTKMILEVFDLSLYSTTLYKDDSGNFWLTLVLHNIVQRLFWKFLTYPCITQHCTKMVLEIFALPLYWSTLYKDGFGNFWLILVLHNIVQRWFWKFLTYPCIQQHCTKMVLEVFDLSLYSTTLYKDGSGKLLPYPCIDQHCTKMALEIFDLSLYYTTLYKDGSGKFLTYPWITQHCTKMVLEIFALSLYYTTLYKDGFGNFCISP